MPKLDHPNFGDVQSYKFLEGIVVEVYPETDTADVIIPGYGTIPGVPIHYHCDGDVDSVQGGSAAFSMEDSVIVRVRIGSSYPEDMRVLGFTDGPKECGEVWEPWGDTICANNLWTVNSTVGISGPPGWIECPSLPAYGFDIAPGALSFSHNNTGSSGLSATFLRWQGELEEAPSVAKYKMQVDAADGASIRVGIADASWNWAYDTIYADAGVDERVLDLSGLDSPVYIEVRVNNLPPGGSIFFACGYIDFE